MKRTPLIIFGAGKVGRALVRQLLSSAGLHAERHDVALRVSAWCDRDGALVDEKGLWPEVLRAAAAAKHAGESFANTEFGSPQQDLSAIVDVAGQDGAIVVDVTASEATVPALQLAVQRGYGAVTANKIPLTGPQAVFNSLVGSRRFRYESTVGSAVPIIEATLGLVRADDAVGLVQGVLSGTLGFVFTGLQSGHAFSECVREAMALGYTEPDPRIDLGGLDVARKALILARTLGWNMELLEVSVQSLVPPALAGLPLAGFLSRLPELDEGFAEQAKQAAADAAPAGATLRYAASLQDGRATVGIRSVPLDSPLGLLRGNDNLVAFHTRYYSDTPLVLQGRGAGVEAAAAGVHSDIIALAHTLGG
jgi:homoserine dehydrogenase